VKGVDLLLKAFPMVLQTHPGARLIIGGDGREMGRLQDLTRNLGIFDKVQFIGQVENPKSFLDKLDIFVAPSREESFGITVCEAMERGLPIVAADVGGIPEIIRHNVDGILVPSEQPDCIGKALIHLLNNPEVRAILGGSGRCRVGNMFSRQTAVDSHERIYRKLYNKHWKSIQVAVSSGEWGGGERLAVSLGASMNQRGFKVRAVCGGKRLAKRFESEGIPAVAASMKAGGFFFAMKQLSDACKHRIPIVHSHLNKAALWSKITGWFSGIPVIAHVHGMNRASYYRGCRFLFAVSASVANHLQNQGISSDTTITLPNGIGEPRMISDRVIPTPPWIIGIVAKLHQNKGHYWALKAIEKNLGRLPDFRLLVFGSGPERQTLETSFLSGPLRDRLEFMGFRDDMDQWYPRIHLALLPSLSEGIPLSLLDAMRFGVPCLATRVGGIPEAIDHGVNGLLVPPNDEDALIDALACIMQPHSWKRFSDESLRLFDSKNPYSALVEGLERTVNHVIEQ
ncbi:MAG: glycosyltransferase family 4 protein, partial [Terrimicrobiaceae bacterium]